MRHPTIQVNDRSSKGGFFTINEADFDPAAHQRFTVPAPAAAPKPDAQ